MSESDAPFILRTLGAFELSGRQGDGSWEPILHRGKPLALLAYCACARRREHSRDALAGLLWSDALPDRARHNVRQALWRLRRLVGDVLETRDDAICGIGSDLVSDRECYLDAVNRNDLPDALRWYQGPFLDGVSIPGGDEFEDWAADERGRLEAALLRAAEPYLRTDAIRSKPAERRRQLNALLARVPNHPDARRIAIDVLLELGDRTSARGEADAMEALAQRQELTLSPSCAMSLARAREHASPAQDVESRALSLDLVGREEPFAAVMQAWSVAKRGQCQVVMLTGVAGIGKSRLLSAIQERCAGRRSRSATVRANLGEQDVPFAFVAHLAHALAALPGAAGISSESARELVALDPSLGSHYSVAPSTIDGGELVRRRALALIDLLAAVAEQQPIAILLDDLHWVDPASRQLLGIVIGRLNDLAVMVVGTSRSSKSTVLQHESMIAIALPPLGRDAVLEGIRSTGVWPESDGAESFVHALTNVCDGIPLSVVERLAFAQESALITLQQGRWSSADWAKAAGEIAVSSPLGGRIAACTETEVHLLLRLAVAGTPLALETWLADSGDSIGATGRSSGLKTASVRSLEAKGLVHQQDAAFGLAHDLIAEHLLLHSAPQDVQEAHLSLARVLVRSDAAALLGSGLRHFIRANDIPRAAEAFERVVARARRAGDARHASDILADLLGDRLPESTQRQLMRAIRWYHRSARLRSRVAVMVAALLCVAIAGASWYVLRTPTLTIRQSAVVAVEARTYGNDAFRLVPSVAVASSNAFAGASGAPRAAHVRPLRPGTSIVAGDSAAIEGGIAAFGNLRVRSTDSILELRFEAEGHRPVDFRIASVHKRESLGLGTSRLRLAEAQFGQQRVFGPNARIVVERGSVIVGVVQAQYTASWPAASVWLSMTPTWGNAAELGRDLTPMPTPVNQDIVDVSVGVQAPTQPGHYWLLFAMDAEDAGGYLPSRTNWSLREPVWGDGNDLADLPDSTIRLANRNGAIISRLALPIQWARPSERCTASSRRVRGVQVKYCDQDLPLFGIEVVVK